VLVAGDGAQALTLAASHASPIHLLVTDVVMPGVNGPELARRLLLERPELAVLFISGYTFEQSIPVAEGAKATGYLSKPFDTKVLTSRVRALLAVRG
jgi:CheY-like chemotaxis protein